MVYKDYALLLACFVAAIRLDINYRSDYFVDLLASILFMSFPVHRLCKRGADVGQLRHLIEPRICEVVRMVGDLHLSRKRMGMITSILTYGVELLRA